MELFGLVVHYVLYIFIGFLWARFIVDWVQVFARSWRPTGPLVVVLELVYSVSDPPIRLLRRFIPPLRLGSIALDLSFLIVFFGAFLLLRLNDRIFLS